MYWVQLIIVERSNYGNWNSDTNSINMANLNTKQTAIALLGSCELVYRINLDIPQPLRMQKDLAGFGDPEFAHIGNADTNPQQTPSVDGMMLSVERSVTTASNGSVGYWVAVNVHSLPSGLPDRFVLMAAFSDPKLTLLPGPAQPGTFAPSLLLFLNNELAGITTQVNGNRARMNLPGTTAGMSFNFTEAFYTEVIDPGSPHHFTIVMLVERNSSAITGTGAVYSGAEMAAEKEFTVRNGYTINTPIKQFRFGLGTASGSLYRASVKLHEVEVWFPS
jgi:hypothetical protein